MKQPDIVTQVVKGHVAINCGAEPSVDRVTMRPVKRPVIVDVEGEKWVAISLRYYQNLSLNVADMVASYEQRIAQVEWYRGCVLRFNERAEGES